MKNKYKSQFVVNIRGRLLGDIWMPNAGLCYKDFNVSFSSDNRPFTAEWFDLAEAIQRILNDGDFQWCLLDEGIRICVTFDNGKSIVQWWDEDKSKLLKEFFYRDGI